MEIITYILSGALKHRDSLGHEAMLKSGDVQRISAGTGIAHSEFKYSPNQLLTSAALLRIDTCPREGIEPARYDEILGLAAQGFQTVVVAAAGYRAATDPYAELSKVRFAPEELITHVA